MPDTKPRVPAPERDLQNLSPRVPPASTQVGSLTRSILGSLAIGLGAVLVVLAVVAIALGVTPLPRDVLGQDDLAAWLLVGVCGLFFAGSGVGMLRRSLLVTLILLVLAVACGWLTTVVT